MTCLYHSQSYADCSFDAATASMAIHQAETRHLVDTAFSDKLIPSGADDWISYQPSQVSEAAALSG